MFVIYSLILTLGFVLMLPLFILRREKYASGFRERLGSYPEFQQNSRPVVWLHCVSVGETYAARPLVDELQSQFPSHRIIISTTTRTGHKLARKIFGEKTDAIFYFPFDWKFSVRKALEHFRPSIVLLMETEIWPRFIREAHLSGIKLAIVNGRLSERSYRRYSKIGWFVRPVLSFVDVALLQTESDMRSINALGFTNRAAVTGNIKFDLERSENESLLTETFRGRFGVAAGERLIVAASTHDPEEKLVLDAFRILRRSFETRLRLLIVPRHPERFDAVARLVEDSEFLFSRRSARDSADDKKADIILLDSIGELRSVYPLADIVFVGGSLIDRGGQSVLEPAAAEKAVVVGPHTGNFKAVVDELLSREAVVQLAPVGQISEYSAHLASAIERLLCNDAERELLGRNAKAAVAENRGATARTVEALRPFLNA